MRAPGHRWCDRGYGVCMSRSLCWLSAVCSLFAAGCVHAGGPSPEVSPTASSAPAPTAPAPTADQPDNAATSKPVDDEDVVETASSPPTTVAPALDDGHREFAGATPAQPAASTWQWSAPSGKTISVVQGRLQVPTIYFDTARPTIKKMSMSVIALVAAFMKAHPDVDVLRIEGHTDSRGSSQYNLRLSAQRAHSIARALIAHGVSCTRLQSVGFGETRPISSNKTNVGRQRNRRMAMHIARHNGRDTLEPIERLRYVIVADACEQNPFNTTMIAE